MLLSAHSCTVILLLGIHASAQPPESPAPDAASLVSSVRQASDPIQALAKLQELERLAIAGAPVDWSQVWEFVRDESAFSITAARAAQLLANYGSESARADLFRYALESMSRKYEVGETARRQTIAWSAFKLSKPIPRSMPHAQAAWSKLVVKLIEIAGERADAIAFEVVPFVTNDPGFAELWLPLLRAEVATLGSPLLLLISDEELGALRKELQRVPIESKAVPLHCVFALMSRADPLIEQDLRARADALSKSDDREAVRLSARLTHLADLTSLQVHPDHLLEQTLCGSTDFAPDELAWAVRRSVALGVPREKVRVKLLACPELMSRELSASQASMPTKNPEWWVQWKVSKTLRQAKAAAIACGVLAADELPEITEHRNEEKP